MTHFFDNTIRGLRWNVFACYVALLAVVLFVPLVALVAAFPLPGAAGVMLIGVVTVCWGVLLGIALVGLVYSFILALRPVPQDAPSGKI